MADCIVSFVLNGAGELVKKYIVNPTVGSIERCVRRCFRFRKIVEELDQQKINLKTRQTQVNEEVKKAKLHLETQEDVPDVKQWCENTEKALKEVDDLEPKIQEDKKWYCSCPNLIWRYRLSKEMEAKRLVMNELEGQDKFERYGRDGVLRDIALNESKDHVEFKSSGDAFNRIMEAVKDDNLTNIVGVWGMGGVGKTTLVQKVGREVQGFDQAIMVTVSREPNILEIQNKIADIIKDFKLQNTNVQGKASELSNRLEKGRFLIILDDLWNDWKELSHIGIPLLKNGNGCKVILTTRRRAVCESMSCDATIAIDVLNEEDAWDLFKMKADLADAEAKGSGFIEEAKKLARECRGLPVAIVTVASALKGTNKRTKWEEARKSLKNGGISEVVDVDEKNDDNAFRCIKMSYQYLKKVTTQRCFLLCALYPEDHSIDIEDLVRYAWALNLYKVHSIDPVEKLRGKVLKDIEDLINSCLLLKDGDDGRNVKLHDIVREVAIWLASKEESGFVINCRLELLNESSMHCKAISFLNLEMKKFPESCVQYSKLEMLLLRNCELPGTCLQWMKNLKVLSLIAADDNSKLVSLYALKSLQNLRALHLENFKDFSFLGELGTVEIFSLRGFRGPVEDLACELVKLENLKILDLSGCRFHKTNLPAYFIEMLCKLEELYLQGSKISKDILDVINIAPRLTALSLSLKSDEIRKDYMFPNLVRYNISIKDPNGYHYLTEKSWKIEASGIPYYLVSLLSDDLESLLLVNDTDGFMKLFLTDNNLELLNLKHLYLYHNESKLSDLRELPHQQVSLDGLVDLKISNFSNLKSLFPLSVAQNLVLLETLAIYECNGLEQIVAELEGNEEEISSSTINSHSPFCFPKLRELVVEDCGVLEYIFPTLMSPQGLQSLTLSIWNCGRLKQLIRLADDRAENDILHHHHQQQLEFLPSITLLNCPHLNDAVLHLEPMKAYLKGVRLSAFKESFRTSKELTLSAIEDLECLVDTNTLSTTENGPTSSALFTNLETLIIKEIDDLETLCKGKPPQGFLKNLKQLNVEDCTKLQVLLHSKEENEEQSLSNLQSLQLRALPELSWILKGSAHSFSLPSLRSVQIYKCSKLESLFSTNLIPSLQLLEEVDIKECHALKTFFSELQNDGEIEGKSSSPPMCLPKLKTVSIHECSKVECVVPITLDQGLPALASLSVSRCGELKQVFWMPKENHGVEHPQLLLPSLEDVQLDSLDKLTCFVPENYIVKAPALKSLKLEDCPRLMNFHIQQVNDKLKLQGVLSSAFKDLLCNTIHLTMEGIGGPKNLVPEVVGIEYLEGLTSLHIDTSWNYIECLVDSTSTEALMMGSTSKYNKGHQPPPKLLSNLEHLQLKNASRLRWIIKLGSSNSINCVNFRSLKVIRIEMCNELEYLFPLSVLGSLRVLEELEIDGCSKLKSLFMELECDDDDDDDDIGIESKTLCLPNLKTVEITFCPSLEYVFPPALARGGLPCLKKLHLVCIRNLRSIVSGNCFLEAPALEILYIRGSFEITDFTIRKQFKKLLPLKELTIDWEIEDDESCNMVNSTELRQIRSPNFEDRTHFEQLFEPQGGYNFLSTLEELNLHNFIWLRDIWKSPIHVATNLKKLIVWNCNNLTRIFPLKLVPHLTQLSTLSIFSCENMKQIIANDVDNILASSSSSSSQGVQLIKMKMVFHQLKVIYLVDLPRLESFSPVGYHSEFPCLEVLDVQKCSNMITSFTVDYMTSIVHAKTDQASQLGETSSPPEDIDWSTRKPSSLPQYVEEDEEILTSELKNIYYGRKHI